MGLFHNSNSVKDEENKKMRGDKTVQISCLYGEGIVVCIGEGNKFNNTTTNNNNNNNILPPIHLTCLISLLSQVTLNVSFLI